MFCLYFHCLLGGGCYRTRGGYRNFAFDLGGIGILHRVQGAIRILHRVQGEQEFCVNLAREASDEKSLNFSNSLNFQLKIHFKVYYAPLLFILGILHQVQGGIGILRLIEGGHRNFALGLGGIQQIYVANNAKNILTWTCFRSLLISLMISC